MCKAEAVTCVNVSWIGTTAWKRQWADYIEFGLSVIFSNGQSGEIFGIDTCIISRLNLCTCITIDVR